MALATYSDLQSAIANHLHRSDMASIIPDLITLAEHKIFCDLNSRQQDTTATLATVAGTETVALPSDFINTRAIVDITSNPHAPLSYKTPEQFYREFSGTTSGQPLAYTVIGSNLYLAPTPDNVYSLRLVYQARVPALSGGANWLMTSYPAIYLYAALAAATPYLQDDSRIAVWEAIYNKAITGLNSQDWDSAASMRVKGDVQ